MKTEIKNIEASVRARLQNKARETNRPFAEIMRYYAMERFLYRFGQSESAGQFILKGALMFTVWQVPERRTTLDIDFLARYDNEITKIEHVMRNVCKVRVVPDGLVFDPDSVEGKRIKENADYQGVRINFRAMLERSRVPMQIDIGFGDIIYPKPKVVDYPVILEFPKPHLKGYTIESVVAEKFEAMIKLGSLNSRMKDFYDVWLMTRQFDFKGADLAEALKRTFHHRKRELPQKKPLFVEDIYDPKSDRQTLWKAFLTKGGIKHAPESLKETTERIEKFLITPLAAISKNHPFKLEWNAPGPWK